MRKPCILVAALVLAGCSAGVHASRRWVGPLTPTAPGPACQRSTGVAQITDDRVIFTPDEGTWILRGRIAPDGAITAERTQPGANKQPFETRLEAKRGEDAITGTYKTPRCTYDLRLVRPS